MTKTLRRALVRLAREKVIASTGEAFSDLARLGYADRLGLIAKPGVKRPTSLRAGYRINAKGVERAAMLDEDGVARVR